MGVPVNAAMVEPLPPVNHACRAGGLPIRLLAEAAVRARVASLDRAREATTPAAQVLDPLDVLAAAIEAALARNRREIEAIEAIEANPRPHGRAHGLEWVHEERLIEDGRLRQVAAILRALAPSEAAVRALMERPA